MRANARGKPLDMDLTRKNREQRGRVKPYPEKIIQPKPKPKTQQELTPEEIRKKFSVANSDDPEVRALVKDLVQRMALGKDVLQRIVEHKEVFNNVTDVFGNPRIVKLYLMMPWLVEYTKLLPAQVRVKFELLTVADIAFSREPTKEPFKYIEYVKEIVRELREHYARLGVELPINNLVPPGVLTDGEILRIRNKDIDSADED